MDELMIQLNGYFDGLKAQGVKIPTWTFSNRPNFRAISAASGVNLRYLRVEPYRQRVVLAVQEIGLTPHEGSFEERRTAWFLQNSSLVGHYLKWLSDSGNKLPEHPIRRGTIFYQQVMLEAGLGRHALTPRDMDGDRAYNVRLKRMVDDAAISLGIEVRLLPQFPGCSHVYVTYQQLLSSGSEERKQELADRPRARQQLYNTRSALNRFRKALRLEETAPVGNELAAAFKTTVEEVTGKIENTLSRKKFQTEIYWWRAYYRKLLKGSSIPDGLHEAVVYLCDRSGLTLQVLSRLIGATLETLKGWYGGTQTPSSLSMKHLCKMEDLFKLPAGTLTNKIPERRGNKRFRVSQLPPFLQENLGLFRRVTKHLPDDFCTLPVIKQEQIVESISAEILRSDDAYSRRLRELVSLPYRLKQWPAALRDEFEDLARFKTSERPPIGMKRTGKWRPATKEKIRHELNALFGALRLPADAEEVRLRGLDLPESMFTLAMLACPMFVDWYLRFRCEARSQYTEEAIRLLECFISLLWADTGWLRQKPQLASRLRQVRVGSVEFVSEELVWKAQANWDEVCEDAIKDYHKLIEDIEPLVTVSRDPFFRIEGIVNSDDPTAALGTLVRGMRDNLPNPNTSPVFYHTAIRDCTLVLLIATTGFRRNTVVQLDYTGDDKGHLYLEDGHYVSSVPRKLFKVEDSPFFGPKRDQKDYWNELPDVFGLKEIFEEYLSVSRPFLLERYHKECNESPLFVTSSGLNALSRDAKSARLKPGRVSAIYSRAVERYLVENKWRGTGIARVRTHGPHAVRHIRGTKVIKETGSFQLAGDANHHSESAARKFYARMLPKDRTKKANEVLFG
jgi:hypothetical protein